MKDAVGSVALLLLVSCIVASTVGLSKLAATATAPMLWYSTVAMVGSGLVLLVPAWLYGRVWSSGPREILFGLISGVFLAIYTVINFLAVEHVGASFITLAMILPVLLTYLLAVVFRMDRLHPLKISSVAAGMSGGAVLAAGKLEISTEGETIWILLAIANPAVMAISNIYRTRYWPQGARPLPLATLLVLFGGVVVAPFALAFEGINKLPELFQISELRTNTVLIVALFSLQYPAILALQRLSGPVFLSLTGPLIALLGASGAFLFLGESAPPGLLVAAALLLAGVAMFQYARFRLD